MTKRTVAAVGRDRGGVCVELRDSRMECLVRRRLSGRVRSQNRGVRKETHDVRRRAHGCYSGEAVQAESLVLALKMRGDGKYELNKIMMWAGWHTVV